MPSTIETYVLPATSIFFLGALAIIYFKFYTTEASATENSVEEEGEPSLAYGSMSNAEEEEKLTTSKPALLLKKRLSDSFLEAWFHTNGYRFRCKLTLNNRGLRWELVKNQKKFRVPLHAFKSVEPLSEEEPVPTDLDTKFANKSMCVRLETTSATAFFEFDDEEEETLFLEGLPVLAQVYR